MSKQTHSSRNAKMHRLCSNENKENVFGKNVGRMFKSTDSNRSRSLFDPINENISKSNKSTTILDVNYDCFERIFNGFTLDDLVKAGNTCTYLQSIVCSYFRSKFRKHAVIIDCDRFPVYEVTSSSLNVNYRSCTGRDLFAFLHVFKKLLFKLTIVNMYPIIIDTERLRHDTIIEKMICKYSCDTLDEIKFGNCGQQMMNQAEPFKAVTKVSLERCVLGRKGSDFGYLFPSMRRLDLIDCNVYNVRDSIAKEFPNLGCFHLSVPLNDNSWSDWSFDVPAIMSMMDLNPNIQSLKLCYWNASAYDAKLIHYAAQKLHQLNHLQLWHLRFTEFFSHGVIRFNSVRKFTLVNQCHVPGKLQANLDALSFENLCKFHMIGEFDNACAMFLARHKTIREISILPSGQHDWYVL